MISSWVTESDLTEYILTLQNYKMHKEIGTIRGKKQEKTHYRISTNSDFLTDIIFSELF